MKGRLIRLGASQLVIVGVGLLTVILIAHWAEWPLWEGVYIRAYALPRMEERWGFRFGPFRVRLHDSESQYQGVISPPPAGGLARVGLRVHDVRGEFGPHGPPASLVLYRALL